MPAAPLASASVAGSYTAPDCRAGSMRLTRPASTLPGPHSTSVVTPRAWMARTQSTQRTGPKACSYSAARMRSGSVSTLTSMLFTTGIRGAPMAVAASRSRRRLGGRLHQAGMERRGHRQQQRALGAVGLEHLAGLVDGGLAAGDDGLRRIVEVHGLDHLGGVGAERALRLGAALDHLLRVHARGSRPSRRCPRARRPAWPGRGSAPAARRRRASAHRRRPAPNTRRANGRPPRPAPRRLRPARRGRRRRRRPASPAACSW